MSRGISFSRVGGACCALMALAGVASSATTPSPVSPGEHGRFARVEARCPSFSWTFLPSASSVELAVFAQPQGSGASTFDPEAAELVLLQRLPGATSSWTPSLDRCLEPGRRYAWYVRALQELQEAEPAGDQHSTSAGSGADGAATSPTSAPWSEARLFEVRERAAEDELAAALDVVRRYLRERGELPDDISSVASIDGADRRRELRRDPEAADRPQVARREETAIPDREESAAGSEPTIVLGGDPVARLAASDFVRQSDDPEVFDFHNPGAGTMTLRVDGVEVVTTATDQDTTYLAGNQLDLTGTTFAVLEGTGSGLDADLLDGLDSSDFVTTASDPWVDEVGDTMTGLLTIDPAAGFALTTGSGDSIDLGGNLFRGGTLFLHATGTANTGAGLGALAAVTTGSNNTAVGANALVANQTGNVNTAIGRAALLNNTASFNTAVGAYALDANISGSSNTALGEGALGASQTGDTNTAIGRFALFYNNASANTAVGTSALQNNTTGTFNTALGAAALRANQIGIANTAIGRDALVYNTANSNTAVGAHALDANTSGASNTAMGRNALGGNQTGYSNTAVGHDALLANTASHNTAVGASALAANTSGSNNTALGGGALDANTGGGSNTALGWDALSTNQTGSNNTAIGISALRYSTADNNTAVGTLALLGNTSGASNTALGAYALGSNQTGSYNIAIGNGAGGNLTTGSNNIAIGNAGAPGESARIRIGTQGTHTDTLIAGIHGNMTELAGIAVIVDSNGELGTISSSRRFKEDIATVGASSARLHELRPVSFHYRRETLGASAATERPLEYGLIAEEVAEVYPELVIYDDSGAPYTVRYHLLVPLLLAELQRQDRENAEQRAEIEELRRWMTDGR